MFYQELWCPKRHYHRTLPLFSWWSLSLNQEEGNSQPWTSGELTKLACGVCLALVATVLSVNQNALWEQQAWVALPWGHAQKLPLQVSSSIYNSRTKGTHGGSHTMNLTGSKVLSQADKPVKYSTSPPW